MRINSELESESRVCPGKKDGETCGKKLTRPKGAAFSICGNCCEPWPGEGDFKEPKK